MTKEKISLEDELYPVIKKKKKTFNVKSYFSNPFPASKPKPHKFSEPHQPLRLNLLNKAPVTFNLGLTYILSVVIIFVMVASGNIVIWIIGIPTLYCFIRHIQLERKRIRIIKNGD